MKINKISFEESITSKEGLKEINLDRLGSVVALVGKNGSGKTRILNFIENNFSASLGDFLNHKVSVPPNSIQEALNSLEPYKLYINKKEELDHANFFMQNDKSNQELRNNFQKLKQELEAIEQSLGGPTKLPQIRPGMSRQSLLQSVETRVQVIINKYNPQIMRLKKDYIKRVNYSQIRKLQDALSDKQEVADSFEKLLENVTDNLDYNEFGSIYTSSLRFLRKLPHQLAFDWIDCFGDLKKFEKRVAYSRYIALKEIFYNLFGKTLEWEIKNISKDVTEQGVQSTHAGVWKIDGREFNYSEFSDGEKSLFAYVLLFFLMSQNSNIRLKESIIIIDEPELHLHPDAEIELINGIKKIIEEKGQLWIATHSINILSHLNIDEVFMVKDGQINHPSKTIQREALSELMKVEDRLNKLSEFITSISEWTYIHFMIECFTNPEVIEIAKDNDQQITSLKEFINIKEDSKPKILLDFGAGKGRLFEQASLDPIFNKLIDYAALEPNLEFHPSLTSKGIKTIYSTYDELKNNSFEYIVLCNVLHEIHIDAWIPTLNKIIGSLSPTGSLIIIEAKTLAKGEQIGEIGYLLLEEEEIQILFNLKVKPLCTLNKGDYKNITGVFIPKFNLKTISIQNLLQALEALENNSLSKIKHLRNSNVKENESNKFGRQAAFLSQQYINSRLALDYIRNIKRMNEPLSVKIRKLGENG